MKYNDYLGISSNYAPDLSPFLTGRKVILQIPTLFATECTPNVPTNRMYPQCTNQPNVPPMYQPTHNVPTNPMYPQCTNQPNVPPMYQPTHNVPTNHNVPPMYQPTQCTPNVPTNPMYPQCTNQPNVPPMYQPTQVIGLISTEI